MKPVEEDRAGRLIEAAENTELYLPILIALYTGMRRGEIPGLRWSDLDLDNARLTVKQALGQTRAGIHFKKPKNKLLRRGIPLKTVSQRLGHANPTVTLDIYAHVMSGDDEKPPKPRKTSIKNDQSKKESRSQNESDICTGPKAAVVVLLAPPS